MLHLAHNMPSKFSSNFLPKQVNVNESCSASVKNDLLRRLRRLNQGQRRATRVEPGARCSYGMCLLPLAGPPRGLGSNATADRPPGTVGGRGWGRTRATTPTQRPGGSAAGRGTGVYMFPCGHMFHEQCLGVSSEGGWRGKRGTGDTGGRVVACSLCSRGNSGRR